MCSSGRIRPLDAIRDDLDARDVLEACLRIATRHGVTVHELLAGEQGNVPERGPARKARAEFCAYLRDSLQLSTSAIARLLRVDRWTVIRDLRVWDGQDAIG
jgi:hypothetical protein